MSLVDVSQEFNQSRSLDLEKRIKELEKMNILLEGELKERVILEKELKNSNSTYQERIRELEKFGQEAEINAAMESAISEMYSRFKDCNSLQDLADFGIKSIAEFLELPIGAIFLFDETGEYLERITEYAYPGDSDKYKRIKKGTGLVGQSAAQSKTIITERGEHMPTVNVGLAKIRLSQMIHKPILYNGELLGVLEVGLLKSMDKLYFSWLDKAVNNLGIAIRARMDADKIQMAYSELAESQELIQGVISNSPSLIYIKDLSGKYRMVNLPWCKLRKLNIEDVIGCTDSDLFSQEDVEQTKKNDLEMIDSKKIRVLEESIPDGGKLRHFLSYNFPLKNTKGEIFAICGISNDITERIEAEYKMKAVWENSTDGYAWINEKYIFIESNQTMWQLLGCNSSSELIGKSPADFFPEYQPDGSISIDKSNIMFQEAQNEGKTSFEWIFTRMDDSELPVELTLVPLNIHGEKLFLTIVHDISNQKEIQNAIIENEKRMRNSLTNMGAHYWILDAYNERVVYSNATFFELLGYRQEEMKDHLSDFMDLIHEDDRESVHSNLNGHLQGKFPLFESEFRIRTKSGQYKWIIGRGRSIEFSKDGKPLQLAGILMDVTDSKQVKEAQKEGEKIREKMLEVERFNRLAISREKRIIELKEEINQIYADKDQKPIYKLLKEDDYSFGEGQRFYEDAKLTEEEEDEEILNFLASKEINEIFDDYCMSVGVPSAIIDLKGTVLASSNWQKACTDFHRVNETTCERCIESDTDLALKLQEGKEYAIYKCRNGLTDCASPVIVEGRHIANIFIGQFHLQTPNLAFFLKQAEEFGFDQSSYMEAINSVPVMEESRLPQILGFLAKFANLISKLSLEKLISKRIEKALSKNMEFLKEQRIAAMSLAEDAIESKNFANKSREERSFLQGILDSSPICVGISVNGIIKYVNHNMSEYFDLKVGQQAIDLYVNQDIRDGIKAYLQENNSIKGLTIKLYARGKREVEVIANFNATVFEDEMAILIWVIPKEKNTDLDPNSFSI
ncbi:MAG: PocR ligand-binding domain-containing protein [Leptospiraceae bacterium]|nr:PocR ligand-binding domain-containing protein [Leptospiraceae bacterium]